MQDVIISFARRRAAIVFGSVLSLCAALVDATPAAAADAAYLSASGSGTACTLTAPCLSMTNAVTVAGANGEVICLNRGPYGGVTITFSITISCGDGLWEALTGSVAIATPAGSVVSIEGLTADAQDFGGSNINFAGQGTLRLRNVRSGKTGGSGGIGISVTNGPATLHVSNSTFYANAGSGISFTPNAPGQLVITDSAFIKNGSGSTGAGILVKPGSGGSARVQLDRVSLENNVFGLAVDGTGSTAGINLTISESVTTANSQDGIVVTTPSGGAPVGVMVKNTRATNNAIGIRSIGNNVTVRVSGSTVVGNGTGIVPTAGGALLTFGNNEVRANGSDGVFSGSVALQ